MRILYNSKNSYYKSPFGCIREGEKCVLHLDIPSSCNTTLVRLVIKDEEDFEMKVPFKKEKTENGYDTFKTEFTLFIKNLYFYYFNITTTEGQFDLFKQGDDTNMGEGDLWQLTCYDKDYDTPEAFKGNVMYQIFPDRFFKEGNPDLSEKLEPYCVHENMADIPVYWQNEHGEIVNNDFYGGNLKGIIKKLPYLKELGVGIIYLNPIFYAYSNHRYDTADYKKIDPMLGDEADFVALCREAHKHGIKIILDGVFSHTGSNSVYFDANHVFGNGACSNDASPYKNWFMFNNYPNDYTSWWGIKTLPCVDEMNPSFMNYVIYDEDSVVAHWMNLGADGFRLDVADELPDEFIKELKVRLKQINPDALLIGEVWEDASNKISYSRRRKYFSQSELDSVMNYPFRDAIINFVKGHIDGKNFSDVVMTICENYPKPVLDCLMNLLSTHDTPRILTELADVNHNMSKADKANFRLQGDELLNAISRAKAAAFLQFTLPGNPCIYYGDEIGMQGFEDPLNRAYFSWDDVKCDMHEFYKELSSVKNNNPTLKYGDITFVSSSDKHVAFARKFKDQTLCMELSLSGTLDIGNKDVVYNFRKNNLSAIIYKIEKGL